MHVCCVLPFCVAIQCILGDPRGEHVVLSGYTQANVKAEEYSATDACALARKLMELFFTREEMANGNCTEADGRILLNPEVISGIRCKIYLYSSLVYR